MHRTHARRGVMEQATRAQSCRQQVAPQAGEQEPEGVPMDEGAEAQRGPGNHTPLWLTGAPALGRERAQ